MRNHKEMRGSITVFLALILSLLLSLVCTSIESVRMASARTQILNSMDIGLYSVFGQYDKKLLEDYDLFALDGSMGGGQLNLAKICDNLESYMKPVLKQNSQKLSLEHSGLTGYRLLTDNNGEVFYQQIVQYMQETLGSQGVQALLNRMSDREKKTEEANLKASQAETGGSIDRYDSEMNQASQKSQQAAEEAAKKQQQENASSDQQFGSGDTQTTQPAPAQQNPVNNPITVIKRVMKMGVLELVLPSGCEVSTRTISKNTLVSGRQLQQGMEMPDGVIADNSYTSQVLFQQYLMNHLGNYMDSSKEGLAYQMEYIFAGKDEEELLSWASQNGLNASKQKDEYSSNYEEGTIISMSPASGSVSKGSTITYVLSRGPKPSDNTNTGGNTDNGNSGSGSGSDSGQQ